MNLEFGKPFHNKSIDQCRVIGARGGRRSACHLWRRWAHQALVIHETSQPEAETPHQAIDRADSWGPWLARCQAQHVRRLQPLQVLSYRCATTTVSGSPGGMSPSRPGGRRTGRSAATHKTDSRRRPAFISIGRNREFPLRFPDSGAMNWPKGQRRCARHKKTLARNSPEGVSVAPAQREAICAPQVRSPKTHKAQVIEERRTPA